jgi:hypothetical protein
MKKFNVLFSQRSARRNGRWFWKALNLSLTLSAGPVFSGGIRLIWWGCDWAIGWWAPMTLTEVDPSA